MQLADAVDICTKYRHGVETGDQAAWRGCWAEGPQLVVAYGRGNPPPPFGDERYSGIGDIANLIFGAKDRLESTRFTAEKFFLIANEPAAFFWQVHLEIKAKDGPTFDNDLLIKVTVVDDKIKEFLEFGDPRKREALFRYLEQQPDNKVNRITTKLEAIVQRIAARIGTLSQVILFTLDDPTHDGLKSTSTAYKPLTEDAYKAEQDLAEKYRSFVSEIMRLSLAGIGVFSFLIINTRSIMAISHWGWGLAILGVILLAVSILFAMRFQFGACEGLRWYIAGLRYSCIDKTSAQAALDRRDTLIQNCRRDKFSAAFFLLIGAICIAFATFSAFI